MKKNILYFMLGAIIFGSIGVTTALSVSSKDVSYDNTTSGSTKTNMQDAIDDLYDKAANMPKGVTVVKLGTATSYNIKTLYPDIDYTSLTVDNFYYRVAGSSSRGELPTGRLDINSSVTTTLSVSTPSISYNTETGVLTCGNQTATVTANQGGSPGSRSITATTTCYMVYAE